MRRLGFLLKGEEALMKKIVSCLWNKERYNSP